ncbi:MAG: FAD-dependent oxidoreductase, partial [Dehalococcoidia bacterium]|nr:FAD-dependent oxidoreductase [Dehalococcoidia bacterium]
FRLGEKNVTMLTGVRYDEITDKGVAITTKDGKKTLVEADTVVLAAGAKPNKKLFEELQGKGIELHFIGDACEPRRIADAMADGARVGREL